jgi:hypothetical protein
MIQRKYRSAGVASGIAKEKMEAPTFQRVTPRPGGRLDSFWWVVLVAVAIGSWAERRGLAAEGMWRDEAQAILTSQANSWREFRAGMVHDFNPPLFDLVLAAVGRATSYSELALKVFALSLGFLALLAIAALAHELFGMAGAGCAALLAAVNPMLIFLSGELRPYSLTAILGCAALWLVARLFRDPQDPPRRWRSVAAMAVVFTLLAYSHYSGLLMTFTMGLIAVGGCVIAPRDRSRWGSVAAAAFGAGVAFLPWASVLWLQIREGVVYSRRMRWGERVDVFLDRLRQLLPPLWPSPQGRGPDSSPLMVAIWCLMFLGGLVAIAHSSGGRQSRQRQAVGALAIGTSVAIAVGMSNGPQEARYLVLVATILTVFCGGMLGILWQSHNWSLQVFGSAVLALVFIAHVATMTIPDMATWGRIPKSGIRTICKRGLVRPSDLIVLAPDYLGSTFCYYCGLTDQTHGFALWSDLRLPNWFAYSAAWSSPAIVSVTTARIREALKQKKANHFYFIFRPGLAGPPLFFGKRIAVLRAALDAEYQRGQVLRVPGRIEPVVLIEYRTTASVRP